MNIQVAILCDAATEDNGKLNLLGAFDTIFAPQLPAVHPQCAVALRVTFMSGDEGERKLKLNFVNADGKSIMPPIEIPVAVALPDDVHFRHAQFHRQHPAVEISPKPACIPWTCGLTTNRRRPFRCWSNILPRAKRRKVDAGFT